MFASRASSYAEYEEEEEEEEEDIVIALQSVPLHEAKMLMHYT